jgi:predicted nucleic acid-binding protein
MTGRFFADTNVPIYALDADPARRRAALSILRARPVISVQVVNEFVSVALGKVRLPRPTVGRLAVILMRRCEVVDLTAEMVRNAIALGERYAISHWDALIVSPALDSGCERLYSEDLQSGQVFENRLTVRNPFLDRRAAGGPCLASGSHVR